ncbi:MAG TPA: glycerol-3-phosphate acyltransferase, partial [Gemmatimonadetes bacterium]|nr:glycerol-3-phosphate acyltransferase [Gemmatimonadota bacterium]
MTGSPVEFLVLSYFFGSIPSSYILGKIFFSIDLRTVGSGNLGTTNALRNFGKRVAAAVLVIDIAKGWIPVWYF